MRAIDRFERFGNPIHNGQDYLKNHIFEQYPVVYGEIELEECKNKKVKIEEEERVQYSEGRTREIQ